MQLYHMKGGVIIALSLAMALTVSVVAQAATALRQDVSESLMSVRNGKSSNERTDAAEHIYDVTRGDASREVDDQLLTEIIGLLNNSEDSVRYWVARSLGNFGPRAKPAVPEMLKILKEEDCIKGSKTSASGIRFALPEIGVKVPASKCELR